MKLLILTMLTFNFAWAQKGQIGNGGDAVVCRDANGKIKSAELLDFYEAQTSMSPPIDIKLDDRKPYKDNLAVLFDRIFKKDPAFFEKVYELANSFEADTFFKSSAELVDIPDSEHLSFRKGCKVEQVAIQQAPISSRMKYYTIDKDIWDAMSTSHQAGLVLHEILYRIHVAARGTNSIVPRYLTGVIAGNLLVEMDFKEYLGWMIKLGLSKIQFDGYRFSPYEMQQTRSQIRLQLAENKDIVLSPMLKLTILKSTSKDDYISFGYSDRVFGTINRIQVGSHKILVEIPSYSVGPESIVTELILGTRDDSYKGWRLEGKLILINSRGQKVECKSVLINDSNQSVTCSQLSNGYGKPELSKAELPQPFKDFVYSDSRNRDNKGGVQVYDLAFQLEMDTNGQLSLVKLFDSSYGRGARYFADMKLSDKNKNWIQIICKTSQCSTSVKIKNFASYYADERDSKLTFTESEMTNFRLRENDSVTLNENGYLVLYSLRPKNEKEYEYGGLDDNRKAIKSKSDFLPIYSNQSNFSGNNINCLEKAPMPTFHDNGAIEKAVVYYFPIQLHTKIRFDVPSKKGPAVVMPFDFVELDRDGYLVKVIKNFCN